MSAIITVPHPSLRQTAKEVETVTPKIKKIIDDLSITLRKKKNPKGVGLAGPQIDELWSIFATQLPKYHAEEGPTEIRVYINPRIITTSKKLTFGPDSDSPILEGCLSIPKLYGPVPRHEWVELSFDELVDGRLKNRQEKFTDFAARVIQHENDHLHGILFTDYSLEYELPVYQEEKNGALIPIDRSILEVF